MHETDEETTYVQTRVDLAYVRNVYALQHRAFFALAFDQSAQLEVREIVKAANQVLIWIVTVRDVGVSFYHRLLFCVKLLHVTFNEDSRNTLR